MAKMGDYEEKGGKTTPWTLLILWLVGTYVSEFYCPKSSWNFVKLLNKILSLFLNKILYFFFQSCKFYYLYNAVVMHNINLALPVYEMQFFCSYAANLPFVIIFIHSWGYFRDKNNIFSCYWVFILCQNTKKVSHYLILQMKMQGEYDWIFGTDI